MDDSGIVVKSYPLIYVSVRHFFTVIDIAQSASTWLAPWTKELKHQSLNVVFTGHFCLGW
jgi:hypothetical protein